MTCVRSVITWVQGTSSRVIFTIWITRLPVQSSLPRLWIHPSCLAVCSLTLPYPWPNRERCLQRLGWGKRGADKCASIAEIAGSIRPVTSLQRNKVLSGDFPIEKVVKYRCISVCAGGSNVCSQY